MKPIEKKAVIPDRIYIQVESEMGEPFESDLDFTHCADRIFKTDVVYVREELNPSPPDKCIPRRFEITFPGILQAMADINNNTPCFTAAFDYYGSPVNLEDIQVYEQQLPEPPKFINLPSGEK